jgi:hypothetical protein
MRARCGLLCLMLAAAGCNGSQRGDAVRAEPVAAAPASPATPPSATAARHHFGAPLGQRQLAPLGQLLKAPENFSTEPVLVEGEVRRACSKRGCWMELSETKDPAAPGCRVTFKDYGFFVPTDSAGSKARIEAQVESKIIPASSVAHLEQEGATFPDKAADGSAREVRLVASGVELWRSGG